MADGDEVQSYGDTGPALDGTNPTGQGLTVTGSDVAGQPGTPLPLRPVRAAANDATRIAGIVAGPNGHYQGEGPVIGDEPWR